MTPELSFRDEILWLAGLLEGEGWFGTRYPPKKEGARKGYRGLSIGIGMTDRDVLEHAHRLMQGPGTTRVYINTNNGGRKGQMRGGYKTIYGFRVNGVAAAGWMMILYPFLGTRRQLKIQDSLHEWRQHAPHSLKFRSHCRYGHLMVRWRSKKICLECKRGRRYYKPTGRPIGRPRRSAAENQLRLNV
jgi:hypothetical protein